MAKRRLIIVSGAHRSGTTWVGQMIALARNIRYIHEPFNIDEPRIHPLKYWFEYVSDTDSTERQTEVFNFINEILDFNLSGIFKDFLMIRGPRDILRFAKDTYERTIKIPLIKDPLAIMSTDWIANQFNADVVIMIRHPAAFVASIKIKRWKHIFEHFTIQEKLMEILGPYEEQIRKYKESPPGLIDQGILLWNVIYYRVIQFQETYPDWIYVKHEDLSRDPIAEYRKLYKQLHLRFSDKVKKKIIESTSSKKEGRLKRDSVKNITSWKRRLSKNEILQIKKGTQDIWEKFYTEADW